jgi:peptidyl-prolyl cis-trans isomerase SurA
MKIKLIAIATTLALYGANTYAQTVDRIIAVVNNNVITQKELLNNADAIEKQLASIGKKVQVTRAEFLKEVLERLISDKVQIQRARDVGINLSDMEFNSIIESTSKQNNLTSAQFLESLQKAGVNMKQWQEEQRNNIILGRLRQKEVEPLVKVSESEIDSYLSSLAGVTVAASEEYSISRIFIPNAGGNLDKDALNKSREKAQKVLDDIVNGQISFEKAISYYSKAPEASTSQTEILISDFAQLPSDVSTVLLRMQRQQLWPYLIETKSGFYILRLNDKKNNNNTRNTAIQIPQTKVRQILIRVAGVTSEKDAKQRLLDIKARIDKGEDMATLATLYSQDGSAMSGGNMNWVSKGEMVPEFEQVMNVLPIGQVSSPVRTDYGYHLIQVLERRVKDVSVGQQRETARRVLTERKTEIVYQDWVRNLREKAFVDYKLK